MGFINSTLKDFGLAIAIDRVQIGKQKQSFYKLSHLNNITEIIDNRIKRGLKLYDSNKIYKSPEKKIFSHLIDEDNICKTTKDLFIDDDDISTNCSVGASLLDDGIDD